MVVCVHGLSRQGRDFDVLARALQPHVRVVCPDVAGRGRSDWLADPMALHQIPTYVADMVALLAHLRAQGHRPSIGWAPAWGGSSAWPWLPIPLWAFASLFSTMWGRSSRRQLCCALAYLGKGPDFASLQEGAGDLWSILSAFGPHATGVDDACRNPCSGKWMGAGILHYDPAIAVPFRAFTEESAHEAATQGEALMWQIYDHITRPHIAAAGCPIRFAPRRPQPRP